MFLKLRTNLTMGIFIILFAGLVWGLSNTQTAESGVVVVSSTVSARFFPQLVSAMMAICGIAMIVQSLVLRKEIMVEIELRKEIKSIIYLAMVSGYIFLFERIGYIISTMLVSCGLLILNNCKKIHYYAIVIAFVIAVYLLFSFPLRANLP